MVRHRDAGPGWVSHLCERVRSTLTSVYRPLASQYFPLGLPFGYSSARFLGGFHVPLLFVLTGGYIISGIMQGRVQSLLHLICHSGLDGKVNGVRLLILLCLPSVHFGPEGSYKVPGTRYEIQPVRPRRVLWRLE